MDILSYRHLQHLKRTLTADLPDVLVETGSYRGNTLDALDLCFRRLFSIEASPQFHHHCCQRFQHSERITLLLGDSAIRLPAVIKILACPILFYLDAHYWFHPSHESAIYKQHKQPLFDELDAIRQFQTHRSILVIDDVRCFGRSDPTNQVFWEDVTVDSILARLDRITHVNVHDDKLFLVRDGSPSLS